MNSEEIGGIFMFCTNRGNMTLVEWTETEKQTYRDKTPKTDPRTMLCAIATVFICN